MIKKIRKDNLRENIITFLIVLFMIIFVGFSVYSSDNNMNKQESNHGFQDVLNTELKKYR